MKKIIGIFICMLLFLTVLPVSGNINDYYFIEEETSTNAVNETDFVVYLPPVHIFFNKLKFLWADVEFQDPGSLIDVNLSELEVDDVYTINQTVYCHVVDQIKPCWILSANDFLEYASFQSESLYKITKKREWISYNTEHIQIYEKPDDAYYNITIYFTGIPRMLSIPFLFYFNLFYIWFDNGVYPCPIHKLFGNFVEYQLHVHS